MSTRFKLLALAGLVIASPRLAAAQAHLLPSLRSAQAAVVSLPEEPETDGRAGFDPDRTLAHDMANGRTIGGFIQHRVLHFTFDDGPRRRTTSRLLDTLDEYGVHATFFLVGRELEGARHARQRELVREMARRGHTIGSHTFSHANLRTLTNDEIVQELSRSEAVFREVLGATPTLIRPPYGARNERVDTLLHERGYTEVMWNIAAEDAGAQDARTLLEQFRRNLDRQERRSRGPGGVVLFHDIHRWVVDAVPLILEELRSRNCVLLEQEGEELWDVVDDPRVFYQPRSDTESGFTQTVRLDDETFATRQAMVRARALEYCR